jgi:hypothetical protein
MSKSALVLAVPHQIQNPRTLGHIPDQSYRLLLEDLITKRAVNFVFEEVGGLSPTIAQTVAESLLGQGHYMDVDPSPGERPQFGIAEITGGQVWFEDEFGNPSNHYEFGIVGEQKKREELWTKRVAAQPFENGLAICGLCHGLSFAFRLESAGIAVAESLSYIPFRKMR